MDKANPKRITRLVTIRAPRDGTLSELLFFVVFLIILLPFVPSCIMVIE